MTLCSAGGARRGRSARVIRLPDADDALATLEAIASRPTVPYHEQRALAAIAGELSRLGLPATRDEYGQVATRITRGEPRHAVALVAHADHPGFEVIAANGREGSVRVLGGLRARCFAAPVGVLVYDDEGGGGTRGTLTDLTLDVDVEENALGRCRIRAERDLAVGQWAVLDLPALERAGDELRLRAADDLAGCALIVSALAVLREEPRAFDVHALFTRAEETGLFGARIAAEDDTLPRDALVVSVEASNATYATAGAGAVVRVGDYHNTFSNDAERYLRVAQERLGEADPPVRTQRRLLVGGTCEASAFVRLGWAATGVALPNVHYHNAPEAGSGSTGFVPEVVRLSDLLSGIALLAEGAVAAGEDASEAWWPRARRVPEAIRELLRRSHARSQEWAMGQSPDPAPRNG